MPSVLTSKGYKTDIDTGYYIDTWQGTSLIDPTPLSPFSHIALLAFLLFKFKNCRMEAK